MALIGVALVAVVFALLWYQKQERDLWLKERQLLITRIQHPQIIPSLEAPEKEVIEPVFDESNLAGTIVE